MKAFQFTRRGALCCYPCAYCVNISCKRNTKRQHGHQVETVQTVKCGYESPTQAANGAAVVQIGKVKYLSVTVENGVPEPQLCPAV